MITSFAQWQQWVSEWSMLPYVCSFPLEQSKVDSWEQAWKHSGGCAFVLESGKAGRYSFLGLNPVSILKGKGHSAEVTYPSESGTIHKVMIGDPLTVVRQWMKPFRSPKVPGAPKFVGGCVGYWGYDVVRTIEKLNTQAADDLGLPDYYFMMMNQLWIVDHDQQELICAVHTSLDGVADLQDTEELRSHYHQAAAVVSEMKRHWDQLFPTQGDPRAQQRIHAFQDKVVKGDYHIDIEAIAGIETTLSKQAYMDAVSQIQEYIRQGDVFQVNLSVRQSRALPSQSSDIYEWLRLSNPSPYMSYLRFPELHIVSASPELLVTLQDGLVAARPIAGTRPRGGSPEEDAELAQELMNNDKERAEHVMLVDLERNDLGKISRYGTVAVSEFMVTEYYSHVMHIVSQIQGELCAGKDAFDVIAAMFPGGTITGAPKIRTMEIIEELEPVRRGIYTGSIGWIDYNGNMEFNIVIRTLIVSEGTGYIQAGAGIVIDSDPEREYYESLNKAKSLWKAIQYSEEGKWE